MVAPLMPKATAVWLVENTTLTFRQIANFCELHELEIQAIADGDVAFNILGISPVSNNQLSLEEIKRCEQDKTADLVANELERNVKARAKAKKILSPSQRSAKPAAILWMIKNCPDVMDSQICKLIGTTKPTIASIRNGTYKDMANLRPQSPIGASLCTEKDLEKAMKISIARNTPKVKKAKAKKAKKAKAAVKAPKVKAPKAKKAVKNKAAKKVAKAKVAPKKATTKKKPAKKKAAAKKPAAKKTPAKKTAVKKAPAKKPVKKVAAKKPAAKKTATKKPAKKAKKK